MVVQSLSHPGCSWAARKDKQFARQVPFLAFRITGSCLLSSQSQHFKYASMGRLGSLLYSWDGKEASPVYQDGSSWKALTTTSSDSWGDDRCIDTGRFQGRCLLHESVFACRKPPAAVAMHHFRQLDSSRLVRLKNSGPVRSGSLAGDRDFQSGCACDLMSLLVSQVLSIEPFCVKTAGFASDHSDPCSGTQNRCRGKGGGAGEQRRITIISI